MRNVGKTKPNLPRYRKDKMKKDLTTKEYAIVFLIVVICISSILLVISGIKTGNINHLLGGGILFLFLLLGLQLMVNKEVQKR